ncbi:MAG: GerMN domain-containing protein [Syntrophomonadaceae bacterium]|jgi:spore germination protein GerM|nr:GerMN domain-containing protein [Syntrophomonadaceae bacterium]
MIGERISGDSRWLLFFLLIFFLASFPGCARQDPRLKEVEIENQALKKQVSQLQQELQAAKEMIGEDSVTIYLIKSSSSEFWLEPELRVIKHQPNMPKAVLEELVRAMPVFPPGTRVLDVSINNYVAYPSFSSEITRMSAGSTVEALAVASIANTLIKFPGVEKVQILVEGSKLESLAGHVDLSEPIGRNEAVLRLQKL